MASVQTYETYTKVTLDLGIARTNYVLAVDGDTVSVEKCEAQLDIKPDDTEAPPINLNLQRFVSFRPKHFRKLFLSNPAATGKTAIFFIGREASFRTDTIRTGDVRLLNVGEVPINPAQEDGNLATLLGRHDITLSTLRDALLAEEAVYTQAFNLDETTAQAITLDTRGHGLLEVYCRASVATTFRLDVSNDNVTWITDYTVWSAVTVVRATEWNGFRYTRLKSDAAGAAGDTVDLVLAAK